MAPINPDLLAKIQSKLNVTQSRAYTLIAEKANATYLPRHLAAVALAGDLGININKTAYATDQERPRWTAQNPPLIDTSKPAICERRPRPVEFYFVASSGRKSVWTLVRQLRGPHLRTWA